MAGENFKKFLLDYEARRGSDKGTDKPVVVTFPGMILKVEAPQGSDVNEWANKLQPTFEEMMRQSLNKTVGIMRLPQSEKK